MLRHRLDSSAKGCSSSKEPSRASRPGSTARRTDKEDHLPLLRIPGPDAWGALDRSQTRFGDGWWNRAGGDGSAGPNAMTRRFAADVVLPDLAGLKPFGSDQQVF